MSVIVDTSAWVDYFRGSLNPERVDMLLDENLVVTNDLPWTIFQLDQQNYPHTVVLLQQVTP